VKYLYVSNVMITDVHGNIRKAIYQGGETITTAAHLASNSTFTSMDNSTDRYAADFNSGGPAMYGDSSYVTATALKSLGKIYAGTGGPSDSITYGISAGYTFTDTAVVNRIANNLGMIVNNGGASGANFMAVDCKVDYTGRNTSQNGVGIGPVGLRGTVAKNTSSTAQSATAVNSLFYMETGSGSIVNAYGYGARWAANMNAGKNTGTITNAYSFYAGDAETFGAGTYITNIYGFYCPALSGGTSSNYAFYSAGGQVWFENNTAARTIVTIKGATSQSGDYLLIENSAGTDLLQVTSDAKIVFTGDTNIYRSAANTLKTDDAFQAASYAVGTTAGIDTTFIDNDGNTITVTKGIITAKTAP